VMCPEKRMFRGFYICIFWRVWYILRREYLRSVIYTECNILRGEVIWEVWYVLRKEFWEYYISWVCYFLGKEYLECDISWRGDVWCVIIWKVWCILLRRYLKRDTSWQKDIKEVWYLGIS
jgi:hypothetical protein